MLYQVKGVVRFSWSCESVCWCCGKKNEERHRDHRAELYERVEAESEDVAAQEAQRHWIQEWQDSHDEETEWIETLEWEWWEAWPVGEDVLMRECKAPLLPGLTGY